MKFVNVKLANQKFATAKGLVVVDEHGVAEITDLSIVALLGFVPVKAAEKTAAKVEAAKEVEAPQAEVKEAPASTSSTPELDDAPKFRRKPAAAKE